MNFSRLVLKVGKSHHFHTIAYQNVAAVNTATASTDAVENVLLEQSETEISTPSAAPQKPMSPARLARIANSKNLAKIESINPRIAPLSNGFSLNIGDRQMVESTIRELMVKGEFEAGMTLFNKHYQFFPQTEFEKRAKLLKELNYVKDVMFDKNAKESREKTEKAVNLFKRSGKDNGKSEGRRGRNGRLRTLDHPNRVNNFPLTLDVLQHVILFGQHNLSKAISMISHSKTLFGDAVQHHTGLQTNYAKALLSQGEYDSAFAVLNRLFTLKIADIDSLSPRVVSQLGEEYIDTLASLILGSSINFKKQPDFVKRAQSLFNFIQEQQKEGRFQGIHQKRAQVVSHYLNSITNGSVKDIVSFCQENLELFSNQDKTFSKREKVYFLNSVIHSANNENIDTQFLKDKNSTLYKLAFNSYRRLTGENSSHADPKGTTITQTRTIPDIIKSRGIDIFHTMYKNQTRPLEKGGRRARAKLRARVLRKKIQSGEIQPREKRVIGKPKPGSTEVKGAKTNANTDAKVTEK